MATITCSGHKLCFRETKISFCTLFKKWLHVFTWQNSKGLARSKLVVAAVLFSERFLKVNTPARLHSKVSRFACYSVAIFPFKIVSLVVELNWRSSGGDEYFNHTDNETWTFLWWKSVLLFSSALLQRQTETSLSTLLRKRNRGRTEF